MRILFLLVFLLNIAFFLWEYRKGAPEIYWLPTYENKVGSSYVEQKIILLSELPSEQLPIVKAELNIEPTIQEQSAMPESQPVAGILRTESGDSPMIESRTAITTSDNINSAQSGRIANLKNDSAPVKVGLESVDVVTASLAVQNAVVQATQDVSSSTLQAEKNSEENVVEQSMEASADMQLSSETLNDLKVLKMPIHACYSLVEGDYLQEQFTLNDKEAYLIVELIEQEQRKVGSYLVLISETRADVDVETVKQRIKQQGIENSWLFTQGEFKGRLSLGLFTSKENALQAKAAFNALTDQPLEIVMRYKTIIASRINIIVQDNSGLAEFEQLYGMIIDQKIPCAKAG